MPRIATQSGYCFMRFDVSNLGRTFNIEAYKCSDDMFANAAADSVREWIYDPKLENGEPVVSKGIKTKVTFRLSDVAGDLIEEPLPIDKNIDGILSENQKAKLTTKIPKRVKQFSKMPTSEFCCVKYDVSQTGKVFNEDVVTCSDFKLLDEATKFIRYLKYTPANYNGEKISSGNYSMLIKYYDMRKYNKNAPENMMPAIGSAEEKIKTCQFE
jgi:protein TonB